MRKAESGIALAAAFMMLAGRISSAQLDCKSASDCRLIYSNCGCEAVPKTDPRQRLESPAVCIWNICHGTRVEAECRAGRCRRSDEDAPGKSKFFPIHAIKQSALAPGDYDTEGYVAKIYSCPPCPPGAMCKPCMRDNIVISEEKKRLDSYSLTEKELILFVQESKRFKLGRKLKFTIRITGEKTTSEPINDIEVVSYRIR